MRERARERERVRLRFGWAFEGRSSAICCKREKPRKLPHCTNPRCLESISHLHKQLGNWSKCRIIDSEKEKGRRRRRTFGNVLDFSGRRVKEEPFRDFYFLLIAELWFFFFFGHVFVCLNTEENTRILKCEMEWIKSQDLN